MGSGRTTVSQSDVVILEREHQLGALDDWASEAGQGHGRLVLISGEAGVGKSTLVEAFKSSLPAAEWLEGACDSLFTPRPLGPLFDMAAQLGGTLAKRASAGENRESLFSALLESVSAPDRLCVVVIEDIHWADEATLDLIRYLGRRIRDASALVLVTFRDEEIAGDDLLQVVIGELSRQRASCRLELSALSPGGVEELCRDTGRDAGALHRLTGGNPFFITEVLAGGEELPPSVRDAVLARIAPLSEAARGTLESAAMVGLRVDASLLQALARESVTGLDELLDHGLLLEDDAGLRFRHELARLAVAESVPAHRTASMHRRILHVLLESGCEDHARLAFHAEGCADRAAVLAHARPAARQAFTLGSSREATAQYQRALRFVDDADDSTRAALHDDLADAYGYLDDLELAIESRGRAIRLWAALGDVRREADSLRRHSWTLAAMSRPDEARDTCEKAVDLLSPLGASPELARAQAALARLLMLGGSNTEAIPWAKQAQAVAGELDLPDVTSDALNTEGCGAAGLGRPWRDQLATALEVALAIPHAPLTARAYFNTHCVLVDSLLFDEADECYALALPHAVEHELPAYTRVLYRAHTASLVTRGRWDEALEQALDQLSETDILPGHLVLPRLVVAIIAARRGDSEDRALLDGALADVEPTDAPQHIVPVRVARAEAAWLAGDLDRAWKEITLARDLSPEARNLVRDIELWAHRTGLGGSAQGHITSVQLELAGRSAEAAHAWDQLSCPYDAAMALLGSDEAPNLREAVVRFDALGAVVPARMARQKMREHGFGSIPSAVRASTRAHPKGLTRREQEVLDLVAAGLRNRDIAERLFLSPKTVAVHVSTIIRKLEVSSRTEAAAWRYLEGDAAI